METAQDRQGDDIPRVLAWIRRHLCCGWNHVFESLMRSGLIEVVNILSEDPAKMAFEEDKQMVQALAADTAEEAFTDGIGPWRVERSREHLDPAGSNQASDQGTVLAVIVTHQIPRLLSKRRGLLQLLGDPRIGWMPGHSDMHNFARAELDDDEGKERPKAEVRDLEKVASPDLGGMVVQEGSPGLTCPLRLSSVPYVLLDGPLTHPDAQLDQLTAYGHRGSRCAPARSQPAPLGCCVPSVAYSHPNKLGANAYTCANIHSHAALHRHRVRRVSLQQRDLHLSIRQR